MLTQERYMEITILHRQGYGTRRIARELGISRNTVRECLRHDDRLPRSYHRTTVRVAKLAAYQAYLEERVKQAQPHRLPAIPTSTRTSSGRRAWRSRRTSVNRRTPSTESTRQ